MPVYDQTYQRWDGQVRVRSARFLPIAFEGIRLLLKPKQSSFLNILTRLMYIGSQIPFLFFLVTIFIRRLYGLEKGPLQALQFDPTKASFYIEVLQNEMVWVLLFTIFIGAGLIARDLRVNAIEGYLAKPLTVLDYVLGKFLVIAFFLACVTLFPCLFLWLADWLLADESGYLMKVLPQLGRITLFSVLIIGTCGLTILAVSSLTKSDKVAAIIWIGGNVVLLFLGRVMSRILDFPALELISPFEAALTLGGGLFGLSVRPGASLALSGWVLVAYVSISSLLLYLRIRAIALRRD